MCERRPEDSPRYYMLQVRGFLRGRFISKAAAEWEAERLTHLAVKRGDKPPPILITEINRDELSN